MLRKAVFTLCLMGAGLAWESTSAQDFRVYTTIQDLTAPPVRRTDNEQHPIVGRSRTLFHANKVYDYIPEFDEVIVIDFNSEKRHYHLLSTRRELASTLHFEEVNKKLRDVVRVADSAVAAMNPTDTRKREIIALHRFQRRTPAFEEHFDRATHQLRLHSPLIRYTVKCADPPDPAFAEAYCRYADAICRLNYVLSPSVMLPEPRLKVNDSLRRYSQLPTAVQLDLNQSERVSRLARHQYRWELDQSDRQNIDHWESQLSSPNTRRVDILSYQTEVMRAVAKGQK